MEPDTPAAEQPGASQRAAPPYVACLTLDGRLCVVVGGGSVAARKVEALLECAARVRVVSPVLAPRLRTLAETGRIEWIARGYAPDDLAGAALAFAATNAAAVNRQVAADAAAQGTLVNVADAPELGDFIVPAMLRQGDLTLAISTGGGAPGYARRLRAQLAATIGPEHGMALELYAGARPAILAAPTERQPALWDGLFALDLPALIRTHGQDAARNSLARWLRENGLTP